MSRNSIPDCQHDWRFEFTTNDAGEGLYKVRCTECDEIGPPDEMNDVVDKLIAENDALGELLSERIDEVLEGDGES